MMRIPVDQLPALSKLATDYYEAFDNVAEFFNGDFRDPAAYVRLIERLRHSSFGRERLAAVLDDQNRSRGCGPETLRNINALVEEDAVVVVTGQQVGLFSGPLYTIYKALTAIKLAQRLSERTDACVVPVFWMATDDHDFAEANHADVVDRSGELLRISYEDEKRLPGFPVGGLEFSAEITNCVAALDEATAPSEFKEGVLTALKEAYRPGNTFGEAFHRWMTHLFGEFGLIFIDPSHPELLALARKVLVTEVEERSPSSRCAIQASRRLIEKGYSPQVQQQEGKLNLFLADPARHAIHMEGDDLRIEGTGLMLARGELVQMARDTPQNLSPNVLLRPLVQDSILPTVAYVGGPGEIAYFAQLRHAYERYGVSMPIVYPRTGFTFIERHDRAVMKDLSLGISDVWGGLSEKRNELAADEIPLPLSQALDEATEGLEQNLNAVVEEAASLDAGLAQAAAGAHRKMQHQMDLIRQKTLRAARRKADVVGKRLGRLERKLCPKGKLQERVLNVTPYLIKYGPDWLRQLYEAVDLNHFDHQAIEFGEGSTVDWGRREA